MATTRKKRKSIARPAKPRAISAVESIGRTVEDVVYDRVDNPYASGGTITLHFTDKSYVSFPMSTDEEG